MDRGSNSDPKAGKDAPKRSDPLTFDTLLPMLSIAARSSDDRAVSSLKLERVRFYVV